MQSFHGELFCFPVQSAKAAPAALAALGKMHSVRFSVRFYNSKGFSEKKYLHFYKCKAQKEQQHWRHIAVSVSEGTDFGQKKKLKPWVYWFMV